MESVVIIENDLVTRKNYTTIINKSKGFYVLANFNCFKKSTLKQLKPNIILLDVSIPNNSGINIIKQVKEILNNTKVIVLSEKICYQDISKSLYAGVNGYLIKNKNLKLVESLEHLGQGGIPMSDNVFRIIIDSFRQYQFEELTKRENEVFQLLIKGNSNASMANTLNVSPNTIKYHLRNIYEKLDIYCRDQAINLVNRKKGILNTV